MKFSRRLFVVPLVLLTLGSLPSTQAQLPAFPGADGAGQYASGGRGGIVYHVTKLNAALDDPARDDPGTLRYGLNDANFPGGQPRTIVFDVAGVFHLGRLDQTNWTSNGNAWDSQSRLGVSADNLTLAGESAPGPVIIMGGTLKPSGSNVIIRNITMAPGYGVRGFWDPDDPAPTPGSLPTQYKMFAFDMSGQNILIDHVSLFFNSSMALICDQSADDITVQNSSNARGQNYDRSAIACFWKADTDHKLSLVRNLVAHQCFGVPLVGSEAGLGAQNDFRNNVFYNWIGYTGHAGYAAAFTSPSQYSKNNFIQNLYLSGPGGDYDTTNVFSGGTGTFNGYQSSGSPVGPIYTAVYPEGNLIDINNNGDPTDTADADGTYDDSVIQASAYDVEIGITTTASDTLTNLLRHVGARWWERDYDFILGNTNAIDSIDERLIHEVITGTGRIDAWADDPFDNDPNEGVEWRALWALRMDTNGAAPFTHPSDWDIDGDGIPGYWELQHGLDPAVTNNNADFDSDGYTDLEEYLNDIAAWPAPAEIVFTGATDSRYALVHNWTVTGVNVNISGIGNLPTVSPWQPSRYDTAVISGASATVDAVGQHAGTLRLQDGATLNITNGWIHVADTLDIGASSVATVNLNGGRLHVGTIDKGASGAFHFTGGTLTAGEVNFDLVNEGGAIAPGDGPGQTVVNGNLILQPGSSLDFELGAADPDHSDHLLANGDVTLAGTLEVTGLTGFGPGTYTLITHTGTLSGALELGAAPDGFAYAIDNTAPNQIRLLVMAPPSFETIHVVGSNVVMSASGPANRMFELRSSLDPSLPLNQWTLLETNLFDVDGHFDLTNGFNLAESNRFYLLRLP